MVNCEELIGATEHVTLYARCRLNRCRYNQITKSYLQRCQCSCHFKELA